MSQDGVKPGKTQARLKARNKKIILDSVAGESVQAIAKKVGLGRNQVGDILNHSEEAYAVATFIEKELEDMVGLALQTIKGAMQKADERPENALKAALAVLERVHLRSIEKEKTQIDEWLEKIKGATPSELLTLMDQARKVIEVSRDTYERQISGALDREKRPDRSGATPDEEV